MNDTARDASKLTVFLQSDAFVLGRHWEGQRECIEEVYYLIAEDQQGRRWAHKHRFAIQHSCHLSGCYADVDGSDSSVDFVCNAWESQPYKSTEDAQAAALKLNVRVLKGQKEGKWRGPWDNENWDPTDPAYGSEAYQKEGGEEALVAFEQECERSDSKAPF